MSQLIPIDPKYYAAIRELAQESWDVQNACNLSGVVHSFSRAMAKLRELCPGNGTEFYNRHPISVMYASKIMSLTHCENIAEFVLAQDEISKVLK